MAKLDDLARAAGFKKAGEICTSCDPEKVSEIGGMDIIADPLMPEGWFALRSDKGAMCVGPKGSFWVPAFDPFAPIGLKFNDR